MKSLVAISAAYLCLLLASMSASADVLLWTVDGDDATVDGSQSVYSFMSSVPDTDLANPAGRVKVSGGSLSAPIYLDNY